jgi:hypothetical protein
MRIEVIASIGILYINVDKYIANIYNQITAMSYSTSKSSLLTALTAKE